jgi:hypothetical protein
LLALPWEAFSRCRGKLRTASGGFTTAIHAVLWAAYEEKIFTNYNLDVEYLALNSGRLGNMAERRSTGHCETLVCPLEPSGLIFPKRTSIIREKKAATLRTTC